MSDIEIMMLLSMVFVCAGMTYGVVLLIFMLVGMLVEKLQEPKG